ncbi:zinc-binding dehydrogenase [Streptomyces sp. NPDC048290]|uniref:zinc-binding dehydrogenase n=1 Tax=Streptomyces sp. NPDC048290 TaxID=3155811 RepID=UPI00343EA942
MTDSDRETPLAAVWFGPGSGFDLSPQHRPELGPGEVLVRVELATLCGRDLHIIAGHRRIPLPAVLGHEAVGVVEETGGTVRLVDGRPVTPGTRVSWTVGTSCGTCRGCVRGVPQQCESVLTYGHESITGRWRLNGTLATHCHLLPGTGLVAVPDSLPAEVVSPANCATATVVCAVRRTAVGPGDRVVVIGCGMLGLTAVAYARERGAEHVVACDKDEKRRRLALAFGASAVCPPSELSRFTTRHGADVVLELSGDSRAVQSALDVVGPAGRVALVGSMSFGRRVSFRPDTFVRNLSQVVGCHSYTATDLAEAIGFLARTPARDLFAALVSQPLPLTALDVAVAAVRRGLAPRTAVHMRRLGERVGAARGPAASAGSSGPPV